MTTRQLLLTKWNTSGFIYEFLAVFTLVFFIFIWLLLARMLKKEKNKIFIVNGYILATFLMFILPWASSTYISQSPANPLINPMFVILQSILQSYDVNTMTIGQPLINGILYLISGQLLGGISGFATFCLFFILIKKYLLNHNQYGEILSILRIPHFFKKTEEFNLVGHTIKEICLIAFFISSVPFVFYINEPFYGVNIFWKHIMALAVIWLILFTASFFGFFAFHLIFPLIEFIESTYIFIFESKNSKKQLQNICVINKKQYLIVIYKLTIAIFLSIVIPIIIGYSILGISQISKIKFNF
ncbi:MAG4940 family membrane protein [Mycoplasmopsis lipofaciens]|uniref:MAG4940 family membrane protein n=1 Tax=Mycoplasmopsis lipofaciens TaxID=114884 RepID=UPI000485CB73|nr:hypothetical protein [Mycoplasmopsis lipofaciens]